jgi:hypothetical protein
LNNSAAAFIVESIVEQTGEMIKINRVSLGCSSGIDQPDGGWLIESEARLQNVVELCLLCLRHFAFDRRHTDQERCSGELGLFAFESIL